ncbi:MAG: hypothetical protein WDZ83_02035 [Rhizobiaceae bacterium]
MTSTDRSTQYLTAADRTEIRSLVSILLMMAATTLHHAFRFGPEWLWTAAALFLAPVSLFALYRHTGNRWIAYSYGLLSVLAILSFGILDGFLDHVLKVASLDNLTLLEGSDAVFVETRYTLWSNSATYWFYEGTGIATFALSIFAAWSTARLMRGVIRR